MAKNLERARNWLLDAVRPHGSEEDVKVSLAHALRELGYETEVEFRIARGAVDLYLPDRRVLIECKAQGKVDPDAIRDASGETQYRQLQRYVTGQRKRTNEELEGFGGTPNTAEWIGILTDVKTSYVYRWENRLDGSTHYGQVQVLQGVDAMLNLLASIQLTEGVPLVPNDPTPLFIGQEQDLEQIWLRVKELRHARTQRQLWELMLEATGMKPEDSHSAERLFIQHCFLVSVARCVMYAMRADRDRIELAEMSTGYINWITKDNQSGLEWLESLMQTVTRYDWRQRNTDVLRVLYQNTISKSMRKIYGEYYTPDWLAQMVVEEVLDADWCEAAVGASLYALRNADPASIRNRGVLDPTCGSGTFLYHAARHLLETPTLQREGLKPHQKAAVVCQLIHGFDIHPVAIEFARTNLLRALPAPITDDSLIHIHQGDALLAEQFQDITARGSLEIHTPSKRIFNLSHKFIQKQKFTDEFWQLVAAAEKQNPHCPESLLIGKNLEEQEQLKSTFAQLKEICLHEGNGVWWYHATNLIAPRLLADRKVDRIIANPPWVRMNELQETHRKSSFKKLAERLQVWPGGQRATAMDIGAIFVLQCTNNFLSGNLPKAAWVLNDASRRAGSWKKFRHQLVEQFSPDPTETDPSPSDVTVTTFQDLTGTSSPFTGAAACVWFVNCERLDQSTSLLDPSAPIKREDDWSEVQNLLDFKPLIRNKTVRPSHYCDGKGNPHARNGATIFPQALVKVAQIINSTATVCSGYTGGSRQTVWKQFNKLRIEVPAHWVREVVFSFDLLVYCTRRHPTRCILPTDTEGHRLLTEEEAILNPYWRQANAIYEDYRGIGTNTPATLLANLDHLGKLSSQLGGDPEYNRVVYNSSGSFLRASRVPTNIPIEHKCYRYDAKSDEEAIFLVACLNAHSLQVQYRESRESDRDFDTHFWRKVPIPRYEPKLKQHQRLVILGRQCETKAQAIRDSLPENTGQQKLCKTIRNELISAGLSDQVNQLAQQIVK